MSEHPSDPGAQSDNTVESPTGGTPPRRRFSWAAILGWFLPIALLAGGGLLWATGFLRFGGEAVVSQTAGNYEAEVVFQISAQQSRILFDVTEGTANSEPIESFGRRQATLARSRPALNAVLKNPKVQALQAVQERSDPVEWLEECLDVDFSNGPAFMRLSMRGDNEEELIVLLNAVMNAYEGEVILKERNRLLDRMEQLHNVTREFRYQVERKKIRLRQLQQSTGVGDGRAVVQQQELASEQLGRARKDLVELRAQSRREQAELEVLHGREKVIAGSPVPAEMVEELVIQDSGVTEQQKVVAAIQEEIRRHNEVSLTAVPQALSERLNKAREVLEATRLKVLPRATEQVRGKLLKATQALIANLQIRLAAAAEQEKQLEAEIRRYDNLQESLARHSPVLEALSDEIDQAEAIARSAWQEALRLQVEMTAPPRVQRLGDGVTIRRVK